MDSSLFPFMAKAFNEIFNKIDEFSKSVQTLNTNLIKSIEQINTSIDTSSKHLATVLSKMEKNRTLKEYENAESKLGRFIDDFHESNYYINFLSALKRILSVVEEIEFT